MLSLNRPFIQMLQICCAVSVLQVGALDAGATEPLGEWREIADEEGIKVYQREVPGTSFVSFRGIGVVNADIFDVYAVIFDIKNKTSLLSNCLDYQLLQYKGLGNLVVYTRTGAPFIFISDRDSVLETKVTFENEKKRIIATFEKTDDSIFPPQDDAVRTKALKGGWILEAQADGSTRITYEVNADPGGLLPAWLVNLGSRKLPLNTIRNMREQVLNIEAYARSRLLIKHLYDFSQLVAADHHALKRDPLNEARFQELLKAYKSEARFPAP
jgi:hypothetical protein